MLTIIVVPCARNLASSIPMANADVSRSSADYKHMLDAVPHTMWCVWRAPSEESGAHGVDLPRHQGGLSACPMSVPWFLLRSCMGRVHHHALVLRMGVALLHVLITSMCHSENQAFTKCIKDQAKLRNVAGMISNRMVDAVQGTNNEPLHAHLNGAIKSVGGARTFKFLHAAIAFAQYNWNGAPLLGGSIPTEC